MSSPIRLDDELCRAAQRAAAAECRTVPQQIAYWARLGRLMVESPDEARDFLRDRRAGGAVDPAAREVRLAGIFERLRKARIDELVPDPRAWQLETRADGEMPGRAD